MKTAEEIRKALVERAAWCRVDTAVALGVTVAKIRDKKGTEKGRAAMETFFKLGKDEEAANCFMEVLFALTAARLALEPDAELEKRFGKEL